MSKLTKTTPPLKIFMVEKGFYSINLDDKTISKLGPDKKTFKL